MSDVPLMILPHLGHGLSIFCLYLLIGFPSSLFELLGYKECSTEDIAVTQAMFEETKNFFIYTYNMLLKGVMRAQKSSLLSDNLQS